MQATGSLAVQVLRYNWHQEEMQTLDTKTRKMLLIHGQHHPRTDNDHLYVPRKEGGKGLMQAEGAETIKLVEYTESKEDPLIQIIRTHQHNTNSTLLKKKHDSSEHKRKMEGEGGGCMTISVLLR
jgi:hypothetical protein